jgi:tRNA-dihydrouridine synthase
MEGLTGYVYRNAHHAFFDHVDKYFTPFIMPNQSDSFKTKELNDVLPEHNPGIPLVPQLLTNQSADFIHTAKKLLQLGYEELNLNLGCPSGTVVSKYRGAGFLAKRDELDRFLEEIFSQAVTRISVKTRIGKDSPDEFYALIDIYNKYPLEELIIHPRIRQDFYENKPNLEVFRDALKLSKNPVCYNGDLHSPAEFRAFADAFPDVDTVMLGRGLLIHPGLIDEICDNKPLDKSLLKAFHDRIYAGYQQILFGEKNILYKMKALWTYMILMFTDNAKYAKRIRKAEKRCDYDAAVADLFSQQEIISRS